MAKYVIQIEFEQKMMIILCVYKVNDKLTNSERAEAIFFFVLILVFFFEELVDCEP